MADEVMPEVVEWLAGYAERLGVSAPTPEEVETLLKVAGAAARACARQAAPVACWLAARGGVSPDRALELVSE
ncbi:MAG TPA: DUF6457 domain-containing protein [Acidimicrobiales bacterium]